MPPPGFEPFLRAICANPEDDAVRLVYADWLDENGDPDRAAFIRISIEWSHTEYPSERWHCLRDEVSSLVKLHGERWLGEFPQNSGVIWEIGVPWGPFDRGLPVTAAVLSSARFAECAERVFALAPIEHLIFPGVSLEAIRVALSCPCVGGIMGFTIVWTGPNQPGDELCELLAGFTHLRKLESLPLERKGITDRGAEALARATFLPQLRELYLTANPMTETGILAITDRLVPDRVRRLSISPAAISERTWQQLQDRFGSAIRFH